MAEYAVVFTRSARRELERLDVGVARRIISRVEALAEDPRPPPTCGEFASGTIESSTRSTTTRASWTSVSYGTEAMLTGNGTHAPNHGIQPTAFGRG